MGTSPPPPLEGPNNYFCTTCQNDVDALCKECFRQRFINDIRTMMKRNKGRPLTYASASPDTTPQNTTTLEERTIPDVDDETSSYVGHMTTYDDPASPDTSPGNTESKAVSEASEYNAE